MQFYVYSYTTVNWIHGVVGLVLVTLGVYDGYRSYFTRSGTTNSNRVIFGMFAGVGLVLTSLFVTEHFQ